MKKYSLTLALLTLLIVWPVCAQNDITLTGTNGTINPGDAFTTTITLTLGPNNIGDISSVNFLLANNDGNPVPFTITNITPISPFDNTNAVPPTTGSPTTFTVPGDTANSGFLVTDKDVGVSSSSNPAVSSSGGAFDIEKITLQSFANVQPGTYTFYVTSGGQNGDQGSYVANSSDADFDITGAQAFTITVVPEPATWSLLGLGGLGSLAMTMLRRRRS